jgi:beta-N-acetylhexosaminidase
MDELDRLAARCVIAGIQGHTAAPEELELVQRGIGGVVLFARNVRDPAQVATLCKQLKEAAPGPLLISIDQEGGRVQRLRPPHWTAIPSMHRLGEIDRQHGINGLSGPQVFERVGALLAKELSACGIDQDYAPVVDVDTNRDNPVIGDRSISGDERQVARLAMVLAKSMEKGGVASCAKHFPGHGDTSQDSHKTLPRLAHDLSRLWSCELVPFMAAARAQIASVMTAHVLFEAFDRLPATLSAMALQLLRKEIGFQGACISDDLEMKAIAEKYGVLDGAALAIQAGCDAVLVCHTLQLQHQGIEAISRAARSGPLPRGRLQEASGRMLTLQLRFAKTAAAIDPERAALACGTKEAQAFTASLMSAAPLAGAAPQAARADPTEWRKAT